MITPRKPFYLGDGAYVEVTEYGDVALYTTDGVSVTNTIILGLPEIRALQEFLIEIEGEP